MDEDDRATDEAATRIEPAASRRRSSAPNEAGAATDAGEAIAAERTEADPPTAPSSGHTHDTHTRGTTGTTHLTAADTMHVDEIGRTRAFARTTVIFASIVVMTTPLLGGDPTAKWVMACGLLAVVATAAWMSWLLRNDEGYSVGRALVFGYASVVGGYCAIYYFGIFSPAVAIIPWGLFFFSTGQSYRATLSIYVTCALFELLLASAVISGLLVDRGLVRADTLPLGERVVVVLCVEGVFFVTFLVARATRRSTLRAIEQHERAVRGIAQREVLLKEARQDLERALALGGVGRFTDQTLGSFTLGVVLGRGGMGEVYEAVHVTTREPAAVKVLHQTALANPGAIRRFLREAEIASTLTVENVVRVLEVGGVETPVPFIAMERLRGEDLADVLRRERRLSIGRVVTLVRQVGRGLEAARAAGIVHRDLKPRNLFLASTAPPGAQIASRSVWKILDFGVSKLMGDSGVTLTRESLVGTPTYMAPEQATGGAITYKTDLFALGVISYRALTGRPAFPGDHVPEILYRIVHSMPPAPGELARVNDDVELVLAVALAKDPGERFDGGAELADALEAANRGTLDDRVRARGRAVLAKRPWGSSTTE